MEKGAFLSLRSSTSLFTILQPFPAPAEVVLGKYCPLPNFRRALAGTEIQAVRRHASAPLAHAHREMVLDDVSAGSAMRAGRCSATEANAPT